MFQFMFTRHLFAIVLLGLFSVTLGGCQTTTAGGAVGANRRQLMLVSPEELDRMAAQSYLKLKEDAGSKGALNADQAMLRRIRVVAARIEPQTAVFRPDAPAWKWEVNVISSSELNAFCMPGGKIMFYSGLVNTLHLTDDEIAIVMGHEISHALREHSREQVSQAIAAKTAINVGAALLGLDGQAADTAAIGYQNFIATKFSRTDESEADRMGLELAARAGYDPRAGVTLWRKMIQASRGGGRPPEFLSTHPAEENRVREIESPCCRRSCRSTRPRARETDARGMPHAGSRFLLYLPHTTDVRKCGPCARPGLRPRSPALHAVLPRHRYC
jgi:predicted Zn-dependent protease